MNQKQIGTFRFGHPEIQTYVAFVCRITPEKKLSLEALEFVPTSAKEKSPEMFDEQVVPTENSLGLSFNLSKQDFDIDDENCSTYVKGLVCTDRDSLRSDLESKFGSCSRNTKPCTSESKSYPTLQQRVTVIPLHLRMR